MATVVFLCAANNAAQRWAAARRQAAHVDALLECLRTVHRIGVWVYTVGWGVFIGERGVRPPKPALRRRYLAALPRGATSRRYLNGNKFCSRHCWRHKGHSGCSRTQSTMQRQQKKCPQLAAAGLVIGDKHNMQSRDAAGM